METNNGTKSSEKRKSTNWPWMDLGIPLNTEEAVISAARTLEDYEERYYAVV